MRICAIVKYPPIQGGVSARSYWIARALAERGHEVHVVTNAAEVEPDYRIWIPPEDNARLEAQFPNGGRVTLTSTGRDPHQLTHIPQSSPFVSQLASLATDVVRREQCDVIFSFYFEPYGVAGYLASTWTGTPHVIQHAGSDRGRLMSHPELVVPYREVVKRASLVVSYDRAFEGLGLAPERIQGGRSPGLPFLPRGLFTPDGTVLDIPALLQRAKPTVDYDNPTNFDPALTTFGVIGKVGEVKGTLDLIAALQQLKRRGRQFNLLALIAGPQRRAVLQKIIEADLADRTWVLPLIPHWRVPEFYRACTAVCLLERDFPIIEHGPGLPTEVFATGVCPIISRELVDKQAFRHEIRSGVNSLVVEDPKDIDALASTLDTLILDPQAARSISEAAARMSKTDDEAMLGEFYEGAFRRAVELSPARPAASARPYVDVSEIRDYLRQAMRTTSQLYAAELDALLAEESETCARPTLPQSAHAVAENWVARIVAQASAANEHGILIAKFELDMLWLRVDLESMSGSPQFPPPRKAWTNPPGRRPARDIYPAANLWLRVRSHPRRIEEVIRRTLAERRGEPHGAAQGDMEMVNYVFQKRGDLAPRVFVVSDATRALLEYCDGLRNIVEIERALSERGFKAAKSLPDIFNKLRRENILSLA